MNPTMPPAECKQLRALLSAMLQGEKLTVLTALDKYGVYALSQRCGELEKTYGWPVKKEWLHLPSKKVVRMYSL